MQPNGESPRSMPEVSESPAFDIVGIGMSLIDLLKVVEEFPADEGITEVLESKLQGGGPVPTALAAAAKLGASTAIVDRIGNDWRGDLIRREYRDAGVDTRYLRIEERKESAYGSVLVRRRDGARHVVFSPGDFTPLSAKELPAESIRASKILHLNGRHWPACIDAARAVGEAGGEVSFDGGANRFDEKFNDLLPLVHIHIAARDFAEQLTGSTDTGVQLAHMIGLGARVAGITDGVRGSWFATADGTAFHQRAFPVDPVVDTTGCGDVFHGAYLFAHSRGWEVHECATFASAAAALNATGLGGRGHLATLAEVRDLITAS